MYLAVIAQAGTSGGSGGIFGFLPFILILVVIYFLMLRPQMKKQKEHSAMLSSLRKNDDIVTAGGLHGRIVQISEKDPHLQIQIAKGIVVTVERGSVSRKKESRGTEPSRQISAPEDKSSEERSKQPPSGKQKERGATSVEDQPGRGERGVVTTSASGGDARRPRSRRGRSRRSSSRGQRPQGQKSGGSNTSSK